MTQRMPLSFRQATVSCIPPIRGMVWKVFAMSEMVTPGFLAIQSPMSLRMNSGSSISPFTNAL